MTKSAPIPRSEIKPLVVLGAVSWGLYAAFSWLSRDFGFETPGPDRPILTSLVLLTVAFVCYLAATRAAICADGHRDLIPTIWIFAVAFRATLLLTEPFQEVDIYRYVWDGHVAKAHVSPYRYSPSQVLTADARDDLPDDLQRLVALRDSDPTIATIISRIHYNRLTTGYPPVSQAVFAVAAATAPIDADVRTHLAVMKTWIIVFDLLTLFLLMQILRHVGKPLGWAVAYGWCPLVIKEFANSGHLDSIAVCSTTAAILFTLKAFFPRNKTAGLQENPTSVTNRRYSVVAASVFFGLAIGAKLFPAVLAPLLFVSAVRRTGWRIGVTTGTISAIVAFGSLLPMLIVDRPISTGSPFVGGTPVIEATGHPNPRPPIPDLPESPADLSQPGGPKPTDSKAHRTGGPLTDNPPPIPGDMKRTGTESPLEADNGLLAFLSRWRMNDFLFQLVEANISPHESVNGRRTPWFTVTPKSFRTAAIDETRALLERVSLIESHNAPSDDTVSFLIARSVTAAFFIVLALGFALGTDRDLTGNRFLEMAFLTLAWFWLLLPTQNPWYWIWALPFLPFARGRAWLAISGIVLAYYTRFWIKYHWSVSMAADTGYQGTVFFETVVVVLEFGPWMVWLFTAAVLRRRSLTARQSLHPDSPSLLSARCRNLTLDGERETANDQPLSRRRFHKP